MDSPLKPRIIAREHHCISRKQISANALRVLYRLHESGYAAYLVGGAVRDLLVGGAPKDFDIATNATPEQVKQLFRNCRLIGRRFRLAHVIYGRDIIEVATFRAHGDDGTGARELDNGRLVRDNIYGSIEEDAVRRDFTANALYYSIADFSVHDFVGGFEDVQSHVLRLIGDPEARYREDPVRMLRAVRLSSKLGFEIDASAARPLHELGGLLSEASSARLFDECLKMFMAGHAERSFIELERHGLLSALMPETAAALAADGSGLCRTMLLRALANTDERVNDGRPVTPAFLFAALLWPAYALELQRLLGSGHDLATAEQRAADRVTLHQSDRIALPRRFSAPMHEIWWLQSRFGARQRKRVFRLLAHPRFRAAFDFLELRAAVVPELAAEYEWWNQAQHMGSEQLAQLLAGNAKAAGKAGAQRDAPDHAHGDDAPAEPGKPRKRRRRRPPRNTPPSDGA